MLTKVKTPRPLRSDAYSLSSYLYESDQAQEKSVYSVVFRKKPSSYNSMIPLNDDRIIFCGLQSIIDDLLNEPVTHEEIDSAKAFLLNRKSTMVGLSNYEFPETLWRRCVDEFNGRIPILIEAMPEGSTIYPCEPSIKVTSLVEGFGVLAAWAEAEILKVWASSEFVTNSRHWLSYQRTLIKSLNDGSIRYENGKVVYNKANQKTDENLTNFLASIRLHDFSYRAGICPQESEWLGQYHLYCWNGTDTFSGAYQAFCKGAKEGIGTSVLALAHRCVQGFENHADTYKAIYDCEQNNTIISMVADLYDYRKDTKEYLLPLAIRSQNENNGKVVVARPDSAKNEEDMIDQILYTLNLAVAHNLYTVGSNGFKMGTFLKVIQGDSMNWESMMRVDSALIKAGFDPSQWIIYGCGSSLRHTLKRDNLSAKYYLCSVGKENRGVVKDSENAGKRTLPDVKVLRTPESLQTGETIVLPNDEGESAYVTYYNGLNTDNPFGKGMSDDFMTIRSRVLEDFETMPLTGGIPSQAVVDLREQIRKGAYQNEN